MAKKSSYLLYQSCESRRVAVERKALDEIRFPHKNMSDKEIFKKAFYKGIEDIVGSIDLPILAEEHRWKEHGKQIVFPATAALLDKLIESKFDMEDLRNFETPISSFMLPMPSGYKVEDVEMTGLLVNWYRYKDSKKEIYDPFFQHYFKRDFLHEVELPDTNSEDAYALSIMQLDRNSTKMTPITDRGQIVGFDGPSSIRTMITTRKLKEIMDSSSFEEFEEKLTKNDLQTYSFLALEKRDMIMQFYAFKIITGLFVYNAATAGKFLKPGFPGGQLPKIQGKFDKKNLNATTLSGSPAMLSIASVGEHYRSWHFRNLRDERFYQGEHKNKPRGSRWVFVSDTMVGGSDVDPFTQE